MPSLIFQQVDFSGGMNQQVDGSRVAENEYPLLINGRTRNGTVDPVTRPIDRTPSGLTWFQGVYAAGSYSIVFASGQAFYKDETVEGSAYTRIAGLQMSTTARAIYACAVPASTVNSRRALTSTENINLGVKFTADTASSPQCLVVQDGVSQPWVIFPDGSARVTKVYNQWLPEDREYVPVGGQMLFTGGILYVVSADGKQIFRSVTGRPLDFMVIVATNGDKLPSEANGGAAQISHKVDYAPITAISALNSADDSFYVSTARTSYLVRPNFDITPYGEPSFDNVFLFTTGAANQFSICDVLGDVALVDYSGIRSFNAVQQFRVDGKNSPFSARINKLIDGQTQTSPAAVSFDNYAIFAVSTVFGQALLVFDTIAQRWTSLDLHEEFNSRAVLMFAEVKTNTTRKLLCITRLGLFELYSPSGTSHVAGFYTPEFSTGNAAMRQKAVNLRLAFVDVQSAGSVFVQLFEDSKAGARASAMVSARSGSVTHYTPPIVNSATDQVRNVLIGLQDKGKACWKCGAFVQWNFVGKLANIKLESNSEVAHDAVETAESSLRIDAISYVFGTPLGSLINIFGAGFAGATSISINGVTYTNITVHSDNWISLTVDATLDPIVVIVTVSVVVDDGGDTDRYDWGINPCGGQGNNSQVVVIPSQAIAIADADGNIYPPNTVVQNVYAWIDANGVANSIVPVCTDDVQPPVIVIDPPTPPNDPPTVPPTPPPATPPPECCAVSLNMATPELSSALPGHIVLDFTSCYNSTSGGMAQMAALYFKREADGSYTYISPLLAEAGSAQTLNNSSKSQYAIRNRQNNYGPEDGVVTLDIGGVNVCVNFGDETVTDGGGDVPTPDPICTDCPQELTINITGYPTLDTPSGEHTLANIPRIGDTCVWSTVAAGYYDYHVIIRKINGRWYITADWLPENDAFTAAWEGNDLALCPAGSYNNGTGVLTISV